jgi:hypothetical protein
MDALRELFTEEELKKQYFDPSSATDDYDPTTGDFLFVGKKTRDGSARRHPVDKKEAPWQRMLDSNDKGGNSIHDERSRDGKYFRRRFRMPYSLFKSLIQVMLEEQWFPAYGPTGEGQLDATKKNRGATLQVKVLSVLRVIGRGVVFDECYDGSGCGENSIRVFFHAFVAIFSQRLFSLIVKPPTTLDEITTCTGIYQSLGMGPAIGSTDVTHISLGNCPNKFKILCTGKSGKPTMAYSLTCSHSRKIYYCSAGFMGSKNDKHISRLDSFITAVGELDIYRNFEWNMDVTETVTEPRKGVHLLCDGGYHKWGHMICGLKVCRRSRNSFFLTTLQHTSKQYHSLFSVQLESVRKDVECTFGILKCRFQILATYFPYVSTHPPPSLSAPHFTSHVILLMFFLQYGKTWNEYRSKLDNVMYTCCILHNLLLRHDGLEFLWTKDWVCSWAFQDPDLEHREDFDGPPIEMRSKRRMHHRYFGRNAGRAEDEDGVPVGHESDLEENEPGTTDRTKTIFTDEHLVLREGLIKQFEIRYKKNLVHWLHYPKKSKNK